jgi:hypothetical protein
MCRILENIDFRPFRAIFLLEAVGGQKTCMRKSHDFIKNRAPARRPLTRTMLPATARGCASPFAAATAAARSFAAASLRDVFASVPPRSRTHRLNSNADATNLRGVSRPIPTIRRRAPDARLGAMSRLWPPIGARAGVLG